MEPSDLDIALFASDYDADAAMDDYSSGNDWDAGRGGSSDDWSSSDGDFSISAEL